jgi:Protein of unknown function (DUF2800)
MRFTASRRALLSRCSHWIQKDTPWNETPTRASVDGTEAHAGFQAEHDDEDIPLTEAARNKVAAASPLIAQLRQGGESWSELAMAYNYIDDVGRIIGKGRDAYNNKREWEMTGTADLVVMRREQLHIYDYKNDTGRDVDASAQLRTLALFAQRALHPKDSIVRVATIMVSQSEARVVDEQELDTLDIDEERNLLKKDLLQSPKPNAGPWCSGNYCPARLQCPQMQQAITSLLPPASLLPPHRMAPDITGPEHAAWMLARIAPIKDAIAAVEAELRTYADANGGISLSDGTVWSSKEVSVEKPRLDVPGAAELIAEVGGASAITKSVTWSALNKIVGAGTAIALREKLRAIGAVKSSSYLRYEARKPDKVLRLK